MSKIEDLLKEALDAHDMGYQQGAWEQMQLRLDGTPATPFYKKWWFAAAVGTVLVGSATFFSMQEEQRKDVQNARVQISQTVASPTSLSESTTEVKTTQESITEPTSNGVVSSTSTVVSHHDNSVGLNPITGTSTPIPNENKGVSPTGQKPTNIPSEVQISTNKTVCLNSEFTVYLSNLDKNTPVYVNGKVTSVPENGALTLRAKQAGNIEIKAGTASTNVQIVEAKHANIDLVDSYLYEKGIPTLKFKASGDAQHLVWSSSSKGTETLGDTYVVHAYNERMVNVELKATDQNGCSYTEKTSIAIQEPYQLLAPTGFRPLEYDPKVNRFIPYALQLRETGFEMIIMDPITNGIVYQTKDAAMGWDGIDQRTNQLVKEGSIWIWKVVLENPNIGEPKEYSGTITRK